MTTTAKLPGPITLSLAEWAIIEHRLTLSDCLADVLNATFDWDWEECEKVIREFYRSAKSCVESKQSIICTNEIEAEALRDCVDGSTWFASSEDAIACGELSRGRHMSHVQSARRIEDKFEKAGLATTGFPAA